jgi:helix-hairpin-helix protein
MIRKTHTALSLGILFCYLVGAPAWAAKKAKAADSAKPAKASQPNLKVDINNASEAELDKLPGIGPAMAKKIVAGRPYSSADDLRKAGIPAKTVQNIAPMVTVGTPAAAATPSARSKRAAPSPTPAPQSANTSAAPAATPQRPPQAGMVWVNLDTKVYHREGHRWYGKTKNGKFMNEADAVNAGYRLSKE